MKPHLLTAILLGLAAHAASADPAPPATLPATLPAAARVKAVEKIERLLKAGVPGLVAGLEHADPAVRSQTIFTLMQTRKEGAAMRKALPAVLPALRRPAADDPDAGLRKLADLESSGIERWLAAE